MEEALIFLLEKRKIQGIQVFCVWFSVNFDENKRLGVLKKSKFIQFT